MCPTGKVVSYNAIKGYGFICPEEGGEDVWCHHLNFCKGTSRLWSGDIVEFDLKPGEKGQMAVNVKKIRAFGP
eukprot:g62514.t1